MNKEFENNQTISHYRIVSKIGKGGMGEVYLAEDTRLDRKVAVKFLNDEFSKDADKVSRFIREAKAASALNHPNILTVYEIGAEGGTNYIAAEFIDGKALTHHISQDKISLESVLDISIQIVSALKTAHSAGIVHRDVKPDNVMIRRDGIVKVLDFGLAKLTEKPTAEDLEAATIAKIDTVPGVVMGTPNYMSPEQARGKDIDRQTDIFSFGIVLYEMLTRKLPFAGETVSDIIASILTGQPRPMEEFNESVPVALREIVRKTLEKDKSKRYQNADDLLEDLKGLKKRVESGEELERTILPESDGQETQILKAATVGDDVQTTGKNSRVSVSLEKSSLNKMLAAVAGVLLIAAIGLGYWFYSKNNAKQIESIAVMPFVNESGNADVEYLSDGMTETLINSLSQIPNLSVKARSSVFRYKGKELDPKKIAAELNVQAILTGRVIQRGEQMTLNLELIDAQTENLVWGKKYERKSSELVSLQSEIARDVSNKLKTKLSGADAAKVEKNYTANAEAYQLYLKGRFYAIKRTAKDARQAIEHYQQAVAIDPNYAPAYAGLAEANWFLALYSYPQVNELVPKARELALKALELDNSLAEPHSVLGVICNTYDRDFACMEREQKRAIELNPNYSEGHRRHGLLLQNLGRFEEARISTGRALEIDPLSPVTNQQYAQLLFYERKYDESEMLSKKNVDLDPNYWYAHWQLFYVYRMKRDYASAVEELAKVQDARGEPDAAKLIRESFAGGDWQGFLRKITGQRTRLKLYPYFVATFFAELGEKDKAFAALNEALETKDQHTAQMKIDPYMNPLRDDPRFQELLKKAGFPQ